MAHQAGLPQHKIQNNAEKSTTLNAMNTEPQQPEFPENDPDQPAFDFESATNIEPATEADLDALDAAHAESDEAGQGEGDE